MNEVVAGKPIQGMFDYMTEVMDEVKRLRAEIESLEKALDKYLPKGSAVERNPTVVPQPNPGETDAMLLARDIRGDIRIATDQLVRMRLEAQL